MSTARLLERVAAGTLSAEDARRELARRDQAKAERKARAKALGRRGRAPGKTVQERRESKQEARRSTRPLVEARENGQCAVAAIGGCRGHLVWDHFFGRGKVPPSVETEWMLCDEHNRQKTDWAKPGGQVGEGRAYWLALFRLHAGLHGYADAVAKADAQLALERAQHPTLTPGGTP